jgi:hypothetical protein
VFADLEHRGGEIVAHHLVKYVFGLFQREIFYGIGLRDEDPFVDDEFKDQIVRAWKL